MFISPELRNKGETKTLKTTIPHFSVFTLFLFLQLAVSGYSFLPSTLFSLLFENRVPRFIFQTIVRSQKKKPFYFFAKVIISLKTQAYMQANMPAYI